MSAMPAELSPFEPDEPKHRGFNPSGEFAAKHGEDILDDIVKGVNPSGPDFDIEDLIDMHPVAQESAARLRETRKSGNLSQSEEQAYVRNIRGIREELGQQIAERLGIHKEDPEVAFRKAEAERLKALGKILTKLTHKESDDELLRKYGLVDKKGNMTKSSMSSPLFTAATRSAFERYMRFAAQFDAMERAEESFGIRLKNAVAASNIRGEAHDAVARLVSDDLGLPFEASRRFVAKAREARIPGTHEKTTYAELLRGQNLAEKFGQDAAEFAKKSLSGLIEEPMKHEKNN